MNVLSLFAGIGGIELGLERAGLTTVGQVDIDPHARHILSLRWPEVPRHDDVLTTPGWWLGQHRPRVDVITAGFPCQPFSLAGKQLGIKDERWMWPATEAVIRALGPRYVLLENVSALVRDPWAFGAVLGGLHALRFDAEWATLPASDFGAPTPRERVYLLAYPSGVDGESRDRLGPGGVGGSPIAARGLSGLAAHQRRWAASEWLEREPRVDRLANGVPRQVDRLRLLGNSVVPAVIEPIGHLILEDAAWRQAVAA